MFSAFLSANPRDEDWNNWGLHLGVLVCEARIVRTQIVLRVQVCANLKATEVLHLQGINSNDGRAALHITFTLDELVFPPSSAEKDSHAPPLHSSLRKDGLGDSIGPMGLGVLGVKGGLNNSQPHNTMNRLAPLNHNPSVTKVPPAETNGTSGPGGATRIGNNGRHEPVKQGSDGAANSAGADRSEPVRHPSGGGAAQFGTDKSPKASAARPGSFKERGGAGSGPHNPHATANGHQKTNGVISNWSPERRANGSAAPGSQKGTKPASMRTLDDTSSDEEMPQPPMASPHGSDLSRRANGATLAQIRDVSAPREHPAKGGVSPSGKRPSDNAITPTRATAGRRPPLPESATGSGKPDSGNGVLSEPPAQAQEEPALPQPSLGGARGRSRTSVDNSVPVGADPEKRGSLSASPRRTNSISQSVDGAPRSIRSVDDDEFPQIIPATRMRPSPGDSAEITPPADKTRHSAPEPSAEPQMGRRHSAGKGQVQEKEKNVRTSHTLSRESLAILSGRSEEVCAHVLVGVG